ncbi:recombination protein RecR [Candidatus Gottesmanbacteria bacterium]|nr:recombination protein RecR [Candidatus Gottesmanbacteria bacterium]MBI5452640.1 recombination protein RecR [Candidatus Gottesmanbacteria bacterium]
MRILPRSIEKLIESFEKLPGIGPKTASRLSFYLLHVPQAQLDQFGESVKNLKNSTVYCSKCFNIGESDPCVICSSPQRDEGVVCVVEQPIDILSMEKIGKYKGVYHVLHGCINPLNNIGPDEIKIAEMLERVKGGKIKEIILATNSNIEGEATAMYIRRELKSHPDLIGTKVKITRLAHGLPVGADIEYADEVTLSKALEGRREY